MASMLPELVFETVSTLPELVFQMVSMLPKLVFQMVSMLPDCVTPLSFILTFSTMYLVLHAVLSHLCLYLPKEVDAADCLNQLLVLVQRL